MAVRRLRAGAPRGRIVVDLHVRQVERDRDVAQAAVDADHALHRAHAVDERVQAHRRPDLGRGRRAPAACRCARASSSAPARGNATRQPGGDRRAGRARSSRLRARACRRASCRARTPASAPRRSSRRARAQGRTTARRPRVAERARGQLARAVERVDVRLDADRVVDQPARRPFVARALGAVRQAVAGPSRAGARPAPTWSGPAGRARRRSARGAAGRESRATRRASRASTRPWSSAAARTRSPRRRRRRAAAAARSPARRPSRSARSGCAARMSCDDRHRMHDVAERRQLDDQDAHERATAVGRCVQCAAATTCASGLTARKRRHAVGLDALPAPAAVWPSKRSTSTGVVFDARIRPKPSS